MSSCITRAAAVLGLRLPELGNAKQSRDREGAVFDGALPKNRRAAQFPLNPLFLIPKTLL